MNLFQKFESRIQRLMESAAPAEFQIPWINRFFKKADQVRQIKLLRSALDQRLTRPGTVLDLPSGDGLVLKLLKEHAHTVYAVNSTLREENLADFFLPGEDRRVTFQRMDPKKLLFPDNAFDYLVTRDLLEEIQAGERERIFNEMIRVTRNFLILHVRVRGFSPWYFLAGLFCPDTRPAVSMNLQELSHLWAQNPGVEILEIQKLGWYEQGAVFVVLQKK